jgi:two-component system, cell cycle sensor histidine kinase and response regulator CckA
VPASHEDVLTIAHGPLILVVDDQPAPRSEICRMVRGFGYPVRSAGSGREALELMTEHPREVRLLIADLGMPRMDGGELAERARDVDPSLRVLLLLEPGDPRVAELEPGYRDLPSLRKPVTFGDLYRKTLDLIGPSVGPPGDRPGRPRSRARRSGHHQV